MCYHFHTSTHLTWNGARIKCIDLGNKNNVTGDLVTFGDCSEFETILNYMSANRKSILVHLLEFDRDNKNC